jgi:hypothetical protein
VFEGEPATICSFRWEDFKPAYYAELEEAPARSAAGLLLERLAHEPVTLLFAAGDETRNNAVALKNGSTSRPVEPLALCCRFFPSAFRDVLLVPQRVIEVEDALTESGAARGDAHVGASQSRLGPIVLVGAHRTARQEQCGKRAC